MRHLVQNGDTIEIIKSNNQTPSRDWLRFVRTSKAKNRIRAWLKRKQREKSIAEGKAILEVGLKQHSADARKIYSKRLDHVLNNLKMHDENELLASIGYGRTTVNSVTKALFGSPAPSGDHKGDTFALQSIENQNISAPTSSQTGIVVGQKRNILLTFCKNCRPLYGEHIRGVITKGKGIKVHRQGCKHLLEADGRRIIKVDWEQDSLYVAPKPVLFEVLCEDSPGVLANMCQAISSDNYSIGSMDLRKLHNGRGFARLEVMLRTAEDVKKGELLFHNQTAFFDWISFLLKSSIMITQSLQKSNSKRTSYQ